MAARSAFALTLVVAVTVGVTFAKDAMPSSPTGLHASYASSSVVTQGQNASSPSSSIEDLRGRQTKRILGIVPNFRSVSADAKLPSQSAKEKFFETTQDSFDYSSFIFVGVLAGVAQVQNSTPQFHQGAVGYGRYYWHTFVDQADENYQVEFFFPAALHQDPRYYTLGHGGFIKRTAYAFSRVLITRTDSGNRTFNISEIAGAGGAASVSDFYYPSMDRTWTKTGQLWLLNVGLDGGTFVFKEFWPDINNIFFHQKD